LLVEGDALKFMTSILLLSALSGFAAAEDSPNAIQTETLAQTTSAWDGTQYKAYPSGQPQITVLKITIPPHTVMKWHSHPMPNAGYILAGDLTIEKKDGTKRHFVAGQAVTETVDSVHRGITGADPVVLIVFYSGAVGKPLSY
jgi:quercetin dioxygenase-like cupin family protein